MFDFGKRLRALRLSLNLTQKELGLNIGSSEKGIQNYELSRRKPTYGALVALADYLNTSVDYLVGRTENPKVNRIEGLYTVDFGERLKSLRKERNLTQKQLAQNVNMAERAYQMYEYGTREPAYEYFVALADSLDVSLDFLAGRADNPKVNK